MPTSLISTEDGSRLDLEDFNVIGRGTDAGARVDDGSVSRQHASIRRQDQSWWITDLGSANGTWINDFRLTSPRKLREGDLLRFGRLEFSFSSGSAVLDLGDTSLLQTQMLTQTVAPVRTVPATLLVGDLKGFTGMSEKLGAAELAKTVNQWYEQCRVIVAAGDGIIDKFVGDCVFAYWEGDGPDELTAALEAARQITSTPSGFSETRLLKLDEASIEFACCVGLHVGEIALGGGTSDDATALGDAVNMAFRVEGLTRDLDEPILATTEFVAGWGEYGGTEHDWATAGSHALKGISDPVEVFTPATATRL